MSGFDYVQRYKSNLEVLLRSLQQHDEKSKYAALYHAIEYGKANSTMDPWASSFNKIKKIEQDCDLVIAPLIRVLYRGKQNPNHQTMPGETNPFSMHRQDSNGGILKLNHKIQENFHKFQELIIETLTNFPFWPEPVYGKGVAKPFTNTTSQQMAALIFWTEHHIWLLLSSAYLFYQYWEDSNSMNKQSTTTNKLTKYRQLLRCYLHAYTRHNVASFEVNSHVYLAYSMAALLNLIDFANDNDIVTDARAVLNGMVFQVMLCTDPHTGTSSLCASTRSPHRLIQRTYGHTLGQLVRLMVNEDSWETTYEPNYLSSFLATTSWLPEATAFSEALMKRGVVAYKMLCTYNEAELERIFNCEYLSQAEVTPMLWSAAGMYQPMLRDRSMTYIDQYGLSTHSHITTFGQLTTMSKLGITSLFINEDHFVRGQSCLGTKLNVFKMRGLVLSSLDMFNPHYCGFEQLPWIANICGIPVYSRSGSRDSHHGKLIANTHNPAVVQKGSLLVAAYVRPPALKPGFLRCSLSPVVYLLWPTALFDNHWTLSYGSETPISHGLLSVKPHTAQSQLTWMIGRKGESFIACLLTRQWKWGPCTYDQDTFRLSPSSDEIRLDCIYSDYKKVSVICVVGSSQDFATVDKFIQNRLNKIEVIESVIDNKTPTEEYTVSIRDKLSQECLLEYRCRVNDPYEIQVTDSPVKGIVKNQIIRTFKEDRFPFNTFESLLQSNDLIQIPNSFLRSSTDSGKFQSTPLAGSSLLGEGQFGYIKKAVLRLNESSDSVVVAVKLPTMNDTSGSAIEQLANELSFIKQFNTDPYLVQCYGCAVRCDDRPVLILEHAVYGSLNDVYLNRKYQRNFGSNMLYFPIGLICIWLRDIAAALVKLHDHGVVHRDLKPHNILVFEGLKVKVSDFGSSQFAKDSMDDEDQGGTMAYMSPEVRISKRSVPASDVFSLGMTAYHLLTGSAPPVQGFKAAIESFAIQIENPRDPKVKEGSDKLKLALTQSTANVESNPEDYGRPNARVMHGMFNALASNSFPISDSDITVIEVEVATSA